MPAPPHAAQILPTGTVTFLFTDIEGSTRLWEAQPEAMPAALARHDELMRYAIGARSGRVMARERIAGATWSSPPGAP